MTRLLMDPDIAYFDCVPLCVEAEAVFFLLNSIFFFSYKKKKETELLKTREFNHNASTGCKIEPKPLNIVRGTIQVCITQI